MQIKNMFTGAVLWEGVTLRGAKLYRADLSEAYLRGADLGRAYLGRADLRGANLSGANLSGANLSGAYLGRADLGRAYLRGANLSGANLSGANLSGADLSGANLSGANGIRCAAATWSGHGECGRQLLAVADQDGPGVDIYRCGCFRGTWTQLVEYIERGEERHKASRTLTAEVVSMLLAAAKKREVE
jgi:hypothetical protein